MVYNRLVDFALEAPPHEALRRAYREGRVVVTHNPRVYALMADKRNLTLLSDIQSLRDWGLNEAEAKHLQKAVPKTRRGAEKYSFAGGGFSKPSIISDTVPVKDIIDLSGFFRRQHHPNSLLVLINKDQILRNFRRR